MSPRLAFALGVLSVASLLVGAGIVLRGWLDEVIP